jgi:hypothetical protein
VGITNTQWPEQDHILAFCLSEVILTTNECARIPPQRKISQPLANIVLCPPIEDFGAFCVTAVFSFAQFA